MKNLGKTTYLVVAGSVLLLSIVFAILFSVLGNGVFNFPWYDGANIGIYWVDKILVTVALLVVVGLSAFGKSDLVASGFAFIFTVAIQILPLLPRIISVALVKPHAPNKDWAWAISLIISLLVLIVYVTLVFVLAMLNKRHLKTQETTKAGEIEVVSASNTYYAQEGEENKGKEGKLRGPRG